MTDPLGSGPAAAVPALPTLPLGLTVHPDDEAFQLRFRQWLAGQQIEEPAADPAELLAQRRAWQNKLHEAGWAGVSWPVEFGGLGASPIRQYLYYEELLAVGAPEMPNRPGLILLGPTLIVHGSDAVKARYLPPILSAGELWAQCFSEPDAGSDLASLRTTATLDGDSWRIDGQKTWVTMGAVADLAVVLVRTGDPAARHRSLTMLLVDLDQPGVEVVPMRQANGEYELAEIFFDGATTPADHVVGEVDGGWAAAMTLLEFERSDRLFTDHGPMLRRIEATRADLVTGAEAGADPAHIAGLVERLTDLWVRAHLLREMNLGIVFSRERGEAIGSWSSPVKVYWAELNQDLAQIRLDIADLTHGLGHPDVRGYLYGRMSTVYSGAIDVQRSIIAERLLGLPRPLRAGQPAKQAAAQQAAAKQSATNQPAKES